MRTWAFMLGGMLVWTVHFFGLYGFGSIFPERILVARILSGLLTLGCLGVLAWLTKAGWAAYQREEDEVASWVALLATLINGIALVAVFWQGFPVLFASG